MLNTRQYLDMRYEALANDGINWRSDGVSANDLKVWDTTRYTNWQDELLGGTANYTGYQRFRFRWLHDRSLFNQRHLP